MWFFVPAFAVGVSAAFPVASTYFSDPVVGSYERYLHLTSTGTILAIDTAHRTITIDMMSPYYIREHAPFRVTYSDATRITIGSGGALGLGHITKPGTPRDLFVGQRVRIYLLRQPGPLIVDQIGSV